MANVIEDGLPNPDGEVPWRIAFADAEGLFQKFVGSFSYRIVLWSVGHVPQMGDEVVIEDGLDLESAVLTAVVRLEDAGGAVLRNGIPEEGRDLEIDLCWRLRRAGWTVRSVPNSVVLHEGGHTLRPDSWAKVWLNHRNNWVLLVKNLTVSRLTWLLPLRTLLIGPTISYGIFHLDWRHPAAALLAPLWVMAHLPNMIGRRSAAAAQVRLLSRDGSAPATARHSAPPPRASEAR